ncbi:MAG: flagellar hook-associated protein FlgL [Clostridiales bacterium]|nr:flagellar hook-associated protein FlgL [Clostridiales bacterium]
MRITMKMISDRYKSSLNTSLSQLNAANSKATDYRAFNKTSDDPFAAAQAYRLRRESAENDTYQSSLSDADSQLLTAQSAMMSINSLVTEASSGDCLQAINGTMSSDDRATVAKKLRALQQAVLAPCNTKFGDKYIFGGSDANDPPFSVGQSGNLLYRGVDVNTGEIEAGYTVSYNGAQITFGSETGDSFKDYVVRVDDLSGTDPVVDTSSKVITVKMDLSSPKTNEDLESALKGITGADAAGLDFSHVSVTGDMNRPVAADTAASPLKSTQAINNIGTDGLKKLSQEQSLVDLGMGLKMSADGKTVDSQSVFDTAIPAISFMGYGTESNGVSNNIYTLLGQIADQLERSSYSFDNIKPYLDNFSEQGQNLLGKITESGTKSNFLSVTKSNLESMGDAILEKDQNVEYVDPSTAIMDYYTQQFSYNAALQMGTKVISKTFLDFMD